MMLWPCSLVKSRSSDDARSNIRDIADSGIARGSCYGNAPCGTVLLSSTMLSAMQTIASIYSFCVMAIAGGSPSVNSYYYTGRSFDVDVINGVGVNSSNSYYRAFMRRCRDLGAIEVLGPGDAGHSTHLHCTF
jgi:hypothetical protein